MSSNLTREKERKRERKIPQIDPDPSTERETAHSFQRGKKYPGSSYSGERNVSVVNSAKSLPLDYIYTFK